MQKLSKGLKIALNKKQLFFNLFIIINFLFYVLSIDPFSNMKSGNLIGNSVTFEAIFGFQIERPTFPLSVGVNTFGIFLGSILILNLIFLIFLMMVYISEKL